MHVLNLDGKKTSFHVSLLRPLPYPLEIFDKCIMHMYSAKPF